MTSSFLFPHKIDHATLFRSNNHTMIIVLTTMIANITNIYYQNLMAGIDPHDLICPCCKNKGMNYFGRYQRMIKNGVYHETLELNICRVICRNPECHRTHALLPSSIVPYSRISMAETIDIINVQSDQDISKVLENNHCVEYDEVLTTIKNFKKKWRLRLADIGVALGEEGFFEKCISIFGVHFMQIPETICGSYSCLNTVQLDLHF